MNICLHIWKVRPRKPYFLFDLLVVCLGGRVFFFLVCDDDYFYYSLVCQTIVCTWNDFTFTSFIIGRGLTDVFLPTSTRFGLRFSNFTSLIHRTRCKRTENWRHSVKIYEGEYGEKHTSQNEIDRKKEKRKSMSEHSYKLTYHLEYNYLTFIKCDAHFACGYVQIVKVDVNILYINL